MAKYVYYSTNFPFGAGENQTQECIKKRYRLELGNVFQRMRCQTRLSYSSCCVDIELTQLSGHRLGQGKALTTLDLSPHFPPYHSLLTV